MPGRGRKAGPSATAQSPIGFTSVAHTLSACTRCRKRKTKCDPGLPRCTHCQHTNATCEYWDPVGRQLKDRAWIVSLEDKVRALEAELQLLEHDKPEDDVESLVRSGASVTLQDADEAKYLGPSSGTTLTRLVLKLATHFTGSRTVAEIIPNARAREIRQVYQQEAIKPTSKVYPLVSDVAASDLPNYSLTQLLVQLYNLKVQPMYPALHEPTFALDVEAVYAGRSNDYQNLVLRLVIAISLQKLDSQYAGLADSYYLAALGYLEAVVRPMDIRTLQAFALIAEYSLLTPTRTAIYFVLGIATRLAQDLGITNEATITLTNGFPEQDHLLIDMRRRLYWCIFVMEAGLSHALGRPDGIAVAREKIDVGFFDTCSDECITPRGVVGGTPVTIKKWICIHFFRMRLLQLEIREKLYLEKRPTPLDDLDPWFAQMLLKLDAWRDAIPDNDLGISLDRMWFTARYNTMIPLLYRPTPQIPVPSLDAAMRCFDAALANLFITREQLRIGNVDVTWIFTQAIFMAINTMLWSLSYDEVRKKYARSEVETYLAKGLESLQLSSASWPGVSTAHQLYSHIIQAVLRVYDVDGDVTIQAVTPSEVSSPYATDFSPNLNAGRPSSSKRWLYTPPEVKLTGVPFSATPMSHKMTASPTVSNDQRHVRTASSSSSAITNRHEPSLSAQIPSDPHAFFAQYRAGQEPLPDFLPMANSLERWGSSTRDNWIERTAATYDMPLPHEQASQSHGPDQQHWLNNTGLELHGLNANQQAELLHSLEHQGVNDIETIIEATNKTFAPRRPPS